MVASSLTAHELLTLASIIEKETGKVEFKAPLVVAAPTYRDDAMNAR